MRHALHLIITIGFSLALSVGGVEIRVPRDLPTIQQGIKAAADGDMVLVSPGTYNEAINFLGKNIAVVSESGPEKTIIDSHRTNWAVTISGKLGRSVRLQGFTVRNGRGGLYLDNTSATIVGNNIITNIGCGGSGICVQYGSPLIVSNIIAGNFEVLCDASGGGIYVLGGTGTEIAHNIITNNSTHGAGGGIHLNGASATIRENLIGWNNAGITGGAIDFANYCNLLILNNLIVSNSAPGVGGIDASVPTQNSGPQVINNTLIDNQGSLLSGIYCHGSNQNSVYENNIIVAAGGQTAFYVADAFGASQPILRHNDLFSPSGQAYAGFGTNPVGANGNISAAPLFLNPAGNDYHLRRGSPAIDSGSDVNAPTIDLDNRLRPYDGDSNGISQVDMGAYEWVPHRANLLPLTINAQGQPVLTWTSVGGARYRVQYSQGDTQGGFTGAFSDLLRPASEETDPGVTGAPSLMSFTDTNSISVTPSRFYRIQTFGE